MRCSRFTAMSRLGASACVIDASLTDSDVSARGFPERRVSLKRVRPGTRPANATSEKIRPAETRRVSRKIMGTGTRARGRHVSPIASRYLPLAHHCENDSDCGGAICLSRYLVRVHRRARSHDEIAVTVKMSFK